MIETEVYYGLARALRDTTPEDAGKGFQIGLPQGVTPIQVLGAAWFVMHMLSALVTAETGQSSQELGAMLCEVDMSGSFDAPMARLRLVRGE